MADRLLFMDQEELMVLFLLPQKEEEINNWIVIIINKSYHKEDVNLRLF